MSALAYRAAVLESPQHARVREVPAAPVAADQVRVRLQGCGVCASNLPVWEGRPWFHYPLPAGSPGHEGWGVIDAVGEEVTGYCTGERVAFMSSHAYAESDVAEQAALVRLPPELDNLPFPGEPFACTMNIFERSDIKSGHSVAVVGAGFLGLMLTQLAARAGAQVVALSRRAYALELARAAGAREVIASDEIHRARQRAMELTQGRGFDRVIEVVGTQTALDLASDITAEHGRLVIAGYHQDGARSVNMQRWNWRGLDVINAHERKLSRYVSGMRRAIDAVLRGNFDPFPLITHQLPLQALDEAFRLASTRPPGFMKAVLNFEAPR